MTELAQAAFACDSAASHTDPHLRDIVWRRENAVLALGTAASSLSSSSPAPDGERKDDLGSAPGARNLSERGIPRPFLSHRVGSGAVPVNTVNRGQRQLMEH
jgi:hypothetical protein